jgi:aminoglycoside 2''-phosphotransferase
MLDSAEQKAELLGRRIREVFPALPPGEVRLVPTDEGQNNDLVVLSDRWVFRFPRHAAGVRRLPRLVALLRLVRRHASVATPEPGYVCLEPPEVGKAFLGYPLIPGLPLWRERLQELAQSDTARVEALATGIAQFLRALHGIPLGEVEAALPGEVTSFRPLAHWEGLYARIARSLFPLMRPDAREQVASSFGSFLGDSRNREVPPALTHGDFGTGNWLHELGGDGGPRLTGVIDFDGARLDDPAVDVAAATSVPSAPAFVDAFRRAYGVTERVDARGHFYRTTFVLQEALFGLEHGDAEAFGALASFT